MKEELQKENITWNDVAHGKYAAQFHKIMVRAKDDLCSEGFESCMLNLDMISEYDNVELYQEDFFTMIDKDMIKRTLSELLRQIQKNHIDLVCLCGSAIRHKLVRDCLNLLVKENHSRISEILQMDEAVVRGLVLAQMTEYDKISYQYVKMNSTKEYYDLDKQSREWMAPVEMDHVSTEAHQGYQTQYSQYEMERKEVEAASQSYREEINKATNLLEEWL